MCIHLERIGKYHIMYKNEYCDEQKVISVYGINIVQCITRYVSSIH